MNNKIYYHYCSVETFFNIMKTSTLRIGNPLSMNDSAEIMWLLKLLRTYSEQNGNYINILTKWSLIEKIMEGLIQQIDFPYILCLSKKNDVLSQWRSYANDGNGVAIGINIDTLLMHCKELKGDEIVYDLEKQIQLLKEKNIDEHIQKLEEAFKENDEETIYRKVRVLISYILDEAMVCKNPAFREENEYRISCRQNVDNDTISEVKFRVCNETILPYREIKFHDIRHNLIQNITLGPKASINNRNLWLFLEQLGFKWKEPEKKWSPQDKIWMNHVKISKATYR